MVQTQSWAITASKMKSACHTDPASPSISLIKQICYPKQCSFSTTATRWGCEHEDIAHQLYCSEMQQQHTEFDYFCIGLVISNLLLPLPMVFGSALAVEKGL